MSHINALKYRVSEAEKQIQDAISFTRYAKVDMERRIQKLEQAVHRKEEVQDGEISGGGGGPA